MSYEILILLIYHLDDFNLKKKYFFFRKDHI